MDESYIPDYENKGYKEAEKLISSLRSKVYKKLSDSELDEFTRAMADHIGL
jgi:succinate dehydrogenase flavin-adding protein (antitoxin of CptAB toxin-antitoxin module)